MRCRECNVDLPQEYTVCPLCGEKTSQDEPKIGGIRMAEYPKVETEKYKRNPFPVFLIVWAVLSLTGFCLYKTEIIQQIVFSLIVSVVPVVWTLFLRPFLVKQLYNGNYIVMNVFPLSLAIIMLTGNLFSSLTCYLPVCFLAILLALSVYVFIRPKNAKRAAPYFVLTGALSVVLCIVSSVIAKTFVYGWCVVAFICVAMLAILIAKNPYETKEELKAKFSIQ